MTVYDALYAVGGPTPFARAADSYVVRAGERIELDAAALWDGDGLHGDLPLQPRDQVVVPAAEVFVTRRADPRGRPGTGSIRPRSPSGTPPSSRFGATG